LNSQKKEVKHHNLYTILKTVDIPEGDNAT